MNSKTNVLILFTFMICCSDPYSIPPSEQVYKKIEYKRNSGVAYFETDIYGNAIVYPCCLGGEGIRTRSFILDASETAEIFSKFDSFSSFERHYESSMHTANRSFYKIIYTVDTQSDTVSVYNLWGCGAPEELIDIIQSLEELIRATGNCM